MHPIFLHRYILKIAETSVKVMFLRKWSDTPEMLLHLHPCSQQTEITWSSKSRPRLQLIPVTKFSGHNRTLHSRVQHLDLLLIQTSLIVTVFQGKD